MQNKKKAALFSIIIALVVALGVPIILTRFVTRDTNEISSPNQPITYSDITPKNLKDKLTSDKNIFLLDVHIPEQEHIPGTDYFIPFNDLVAYKSELPNDKDAEIVVYCRSGSMSKTASQELIDLGYTNVNNLSGGINAWKAQGYNL